ncbi:MAG: sigma 54-interacting transcriptional regulator [candidate division FCPU426 bacterium]
MITERRPPLLIVSKSQSLADSLSGLGPTPMVESVDDALAVLELRELPVLLIEMNVPGDPELLLKRALEADRDCQVLVFASDKESSAALKVLSQGAAEVLPRPCDPGRAVAAVQRAGLLWKFQRELRHWKAAPDKVKDFQLLGGSALMKAMRDKVAKVAVADSSVLITGEAGTGKARTARLIHACSARSEERFVALDCAAPPTGGMEEALFGAEASDALGALSAASGGTLYLHDVDRLDLASQEHLLQAIKDKAHTRMGGNRLHAVDVRLLASTREDLRAAVQARSFSDGLFGALSGAVLEMPPLRDRPADIEEMLLIFLADDSHGLGRITPHVPAPIMDKIKAHSFPGNVRELRNLAGVMASLGESGEINIAALPSQLLAPIRLQGQAAEGSMALKPAVREFERQYLIRVLKTVSGNQSKASRVLGIHRNTLILKMQELGIPNRKERGKKK